MQLRADGRTRGLAGIAPLVETDWLVRLRHYLCFVVLVPLTYSLVYTVLRGLQPICTFTARQLRSRSPDAFLLPTDVLDDEATSSHVNENVNGSINVLDRPLGIPTNAWLAGVLDFWLPAATVCSGGWWYFWNACQILPTFERCEEMNMVNSRVSLPALFVTTVVSLGVSLLHLSLFAPLLSAGRVEAANLVRLVATLATMLWWPVSNVVTKIWFVLLWPDRPLRARTVWDATKAGFFVQFHGFLTIGVAVFLANVVVQSAVEAMRKWESTVLQTAGECLTIGIYFNLWLPFTEKMWGFVWHPMILPSRADFKILRTSQTRSPEKAEHTTSAPPIPAPDEEEEDLFAKAGNVENTLRTRRQIIMYASQIFFDLLRFVFGRGVLFELSPAALVLILLKDSTYHWWHFGFRQLEAALLFTVQISHPHPLTRGLITPSRWRLLSRITFQLQRISSVSRHLAVAFDEVIDYPTLARTLRVNRSSESNESGTKFHVGAVEEGAEQAMECDDLRLHFSNIRITLENVPRDVLLAIFNDEHNFSGGAVEKVASRVAAASSAASSVGSLRSSTADSGGINTSATTDTEAGFPRSATAPGGDPKVMVAPTPASGPSSLPLTRRQSFLETQALKVLSVAASMQLSAVVKRAPFSLSDQRAEDDDRVMDALASSVALSSKQTRSASASAPTHERKASLASRGRSSASVVPDSTSSTASLAFQRPPTEQARTKTVTEGELHLLRSFIRFYRQENFVRYQIRSHTRVFVSCLMIFVPLLSATGNVYYFAGYPQEESLAQMLALPLLFFAKDVLEWWLITFKFMLYNEEQVARITPALVLQRHLCGFELSKAWLRGSAAGQVLFAGIFGYSCYFGVLLYVLRWNPYNLAKIRDLTGLGEELEWAHIFQFCGLGEGQG